jgi:protein-export membrane protein SecD
MLYIPPWQRMLILAVCLLGVLFSIPNFFPTTMLDRWPSYVPKKQVALGLDLRGGSYLLYEVDMQSAEKDELNNIVDELRTALIAQKINYTGLAVDGDHVALVLSDKAREADLREIVQKISAGLELTVSAAGAVAVKPSAPDLEQRRDSALDQSIEIIRRRIDETGTKEATIQRVGQDRILVELPGIDDPERVKALIGKTAKMTFQLVDETASVEDARRGKLPAGDELLQGQEDRATAPQGYVVKRRVMVSGDTLTNAQPSFGSTNQPVVSFKFDSVGGRRFADATRENVGKRFAIVLDNKVISAPVIKEPILGGSGIIEGSFSVQTANDLALLLRAGALPAPLTILEERTVGPDLGADSIHAGALASVVGISLVVVFMVIFYGLFGLFADVALFFNLCIMLASLSLLGATLTLPGIAGIALTMGMAVDANVLIYERIREELRGGRSIISSLQAGFERAFGTILDSHVTTLVAGALMFWLGEGPIKGFAVTLSIGVLTSLFSAILVTRLQIVTWLRRTKPKLIPI